MLCSRDPFARQEIYREVCYKYTGLTGEHRCSWCGNQSPINKNLQRRLFKYSVESDGGRKSYIQGQFCSISCMRSYHGN